MTTNILRRVKALEARRAEEQAAAQKKSFGRSAVRIVLGYFLGGLKSGGCPMRAFARALQYEDEEGLYKDFADVIKTGNPSQFHNRCQNAYRQLFTKLHFDLHPLKESDKFYEAMAEIAERLPNEWKKHISPSADTGEDEIELEKLVEEILNGSARNLRNFRVFTQIGPVHIRRSKLLR